VDLTGGGALLWLAMANCRLCWRSFSGDPLSLPSPAQHALGGEERSGGWSCAEGRGHGAATWRGGAPSEPPGPGLSRQWRALSVAAVTAHRRERERGRDRQTHTERG